MGRRAKFRVDIGFDLRIRLSVQGSSMLGLLFVVFVHDPLVWDLSFLKGI